MFNQQIFSSKMDPSTLMDTSGGMDDEDDILYQPIEETVYVLDTCVMPNPATTPLSAESKSKRGKAGPAKPKIVLQKKPTKAELKKQQKQQRDLLKECIQELDSEDCEDVVTLPNHPMPSSSVTKVEKPVIQLRVAPKIILKGGRHSLTKRDCELIKDCVEALADQDCVETFKLKTRVNQLCNSEWGKVADIIVKLMHQYLPENGIQAIDHNHIEQARYQMKETYRWAGYVVGKDFIYSERIRSITQDACYQAMREKNNELNPRKVASRKKSSQNFANKKARQGKSYGILVLDDTEAGNISNQKRLHYKAFCDELSMLQVGHQFTSQQIELADSYWDCLMASLMKADYRQFHILQATGELAILKHIRLYLNFVRKITKREDTVIHKFQENCDLFLVCLEDLLKSFPPKDLYDIKTLDVKNSPYISLVKIIASLLGRGTSFIIDPSVSSEMSIDETGPICLVKAGNFYDLWIHGVVVVPRMQEIQAIFCLATSEDVFRITQKSSTDSSDVIDFMRKFLLMIPDFQMKAPQITLLGQAFSSFSELYKTKMGGFPKPNKFLCYDKARDAIHVLE